MSQRKNRIVILGSDSFIAKHLIKRLRFKKNNLVLINRKRIDLEKENCIKSLSKIIRGNDICIFVAANAPVKNEKMFLSNILICRNICNVIKKKKIKHLVYVSSDAVYSDSKKKIKETSKKKPENLHGLMHITREIMIKNSINNNKITIVRPTLIYGNGDPHNGYGPNRFLRLAKQNKNIHLFGRGEELRDHIWVEDVANMIFLILKKKIIGEYNLVTAKLISFNQIAKIIIKRLKSKSKIIYTKRTSPIPHNGYRAFSRSLLHKKIRNLKLKNFV